jgi:hypothetical protein
MPELTYQGFLKPRLNGTSVEKDEAAIKLQHTKSTLWERKIYTQAEITSVITTLFNSWLSRKPLH